MKLFIKIIFVAYMMSLTSVARSDYGNWRYEPEGIFGEPAIATPIFNPTESDCKKCTATLYVSRNPEYPFAKAFIAFGRDAEPEHFLSGEYTGGYTQAISFIIDGGGSQLKAINMTPHYGWEILDGEYVAEALKNANTIDMILLIKKPRFILKDTSEAISYKINLDKGRDKIKEWSNSAY